jgi:hypothetical protein
MRLLNTDWPHKIFGRYIAEQRALGAGQQALGQPRSMAWTRLWLLMLFPTLWGISAVNMATQPSNWVARRVAGDGVAAGTQAELSYQRSSRSDPDRPNRERSSQYRHVRLKIWRAGQVVLDDILPRQKSTDQPLLEQSLAGLQVKDLDNDRQPEVVVDFYTGGAHCCHYSLIYRFDPQKQTYTATQHNWGNGFYHLADLNGDGIVEFEGQDDRFVGRFASYAGSTFPTQIWRFEQGRMVDQTRSFPAQLEASATRNLLTMQQSVMTQGEAKGAIAAYLADKYSQGRGAEGWQLVQQLYIGPDRERFFAKLQQFLQTAGYVSDRPSNQVVKSN